MATNTPVAIGLLAAAILVGCSGTSADTTTSAAPTDTTTTAPPASTTTLPATTSTTAPATTTTVPAAPVSYEYAIGVGTDGIEYKLGGEELETVGPNQVAASNGAVYVADPIGDVLWVINDSGSQAIDLIELDILNVVAMTATDEKLYLVEVFFAPARQRLHTLSLSGVLEASIDRRIAKERRPLPSRRAEDRVFLRLELAFRLELRSSGRPARRRTACCCSIHAAVCTPFLQLERATEALVLALEQREEGRRVSRFSI